MYKNNQDNEAPRKTNWLPWTLTAVLGVLLIFNYVGTSASISSRLMPSLFALICPLMMMFMICGHRHNHNKSNEHGTESSSSCCHTHEPRKADSK